MSNRFDEIAAKERADFEAAQAAIKSAADAASDQRASEIANAKSLLDQHVRPNLSDMASALIKQGIQVKYEDNFADLAGYTNRRPAIKIWTLGPPDRHGYRFETAPVFFEASGGQLHLAVGLHANAKFSEKQIEMAPAMDKARVATLLDTAIALLMKQYYSELTKG